MEEKKCVYVVHLSGCNGTDNMTVFEDELEAYHFMMKEMEGILSSLADAGYTGDRAPQYVKEDAYCEVWTPDTRFYYEWNIYEAPSITNGETHH